MSTLRANRLKGFLIAAVVLALDLGVKAMVMGRWRCARSRRGQIELLPFFRLTFTQNFGVSLGMFTADSAEMRWALVAVTALIALVVLRVDARTRRSWAISSRWRWSSAGRWAISATAFSYGYVIDYADLHFGEWRPFLIFNIADAAISIGVVIILARALFLREKPADESGGESDNPENGPCHRRTIGRGDQVMRKTHPLP